jgi:hypothetical protein
MGIIVFGLGFASALYDFLPFPIYILLMMVTIITGLLIFLLGKKFVSKPRIGVVKFGQKRKKRKVRTVIVLSINVIVLFIMYYILASVRDLRILIPPYLDSLIIGLLFITLPMCIIAYLLQFPRLYIIGILFGSVVFLLEILSLFIAYPVSGVVAYSITGGIMILMGFYYLSRFIKKYPLDQKEE